MTEARACKDANQEGRLGVTSHALGTSKECEGMNPHTVKELSFWELKSWWAPKYSEGDCNGQNPMEEFFISLESY